MGLIRAHLVVSEAGMNDLGSAGMTTGWLSAWLQSAGAAHVDLHLLESDTWKHVTGWQIFYAGESELMRIALYHGKRIQAREDGGRTLLGVDVLPLQNPERIAWHYILDDHSHCVLLPLGDIAYQRERWLHVLNAGRPLLPLYIYPGEHAGTVLEPGLCGCVQMPEEDFEQPVNDGGYLPEETLMHKLKARSLKVRFAESCTAGGLSERLSRLPGASGVLEGGWVTYSNEAKHKLLKVPGRLLKKYGAVSREVVECMAKAGCDRTHVCVAVSGIAGPDGSSEGKPVGLVWIAAAWVEGKLRVTKKTSVQCGNFSGSRAAIRQQAVNHAFALLARVLSLHA